MIGELVSGGTEVPRGLKPAPRRLQRQGRESVLSTTTTTTTTQTTKKRNRILLVSYLFPPAGGIPVQRILSLARFLPENDYEVHVLCCSNPGVPTMDPSLLERVPKEVRIHRVFSPELSFAARQRVWSILSPGGGKKAAAPAATTAVVAAPGSPSLLKRMVQGVMRRIYCPDPEVVWVPFATRAARKIVREYGIDTMLITMPPYSSILVGLQLKKELGDALTLVADFRDEWLDYYLHAFPFYRSAHIQKRAAAIERETAERADLIVAVTPTVQEQMRARYPDVEAEKFGLVWNGYDPLALEGFCREGRKHDLGEGKVLVSYAGTMHETSSPKQYFEALDRLPEEVRGRVVTRMIGRVTDDLEYLLHGRKCEIQRFGFLPQKEAFRMLEETDYLLLIQHHAPSLPGKAFEYLGMGKPILAIAAPGSELARLIDETGAGMWADPGDLAAVERMLTAAAEGHGGPTARDGSVVERFDRRNLTREYARLMRGAKRRS